MLSPPPPLGPAYLFRPPGTGVGGAARSKGRLLGLRSSSPRFEIENVNFFQLQVKEKTSKQCSNESLLSDMPCVHTHVACIVCQGLHTERALLIHYVINFPARLYSHLVM